MKRIILAFLVLTFTVLGMKSWNGSTHSEPAQDIPDSQVLQLNSSPGMEFRYQMKLDSELEFSSLQDSQKEKYRLTGEVILRSYQQTASGLLWGARLAEGSANLGSSGEQLFTYDDEIYFLSQNGDVLEFFLDHSLDTIYVNTIKSIALALQIKSPDATQRIHTGDSWTHLEPSMNGLIDSTYTSFSTKSWFRLTKQFTHLRNADGIKIKPGSSAEYTYDLQTGQISALNYQLGLINQASSVKILGHQNLQLQLISFRTDLEQMNILDQLQARLIQEKPNHVAQLTEQERLANYAKLVSNTSPQQLLGELKSLQSLQDENAPDLLLQLEAMVALDAEFAVGLLHHLEDGFESENFMDQLSLIMGALASMNAEAIESELLDYSYRHLENPDISQQTAFALAELSGASQQVFDFLEDLVRADAPDLRTIGLLSLGTLGQQEEHADNSSQFLHKALRQASDLEKPTILAALSNSKNVDNLETFASYLLSGDESQMRQAIFGLKHIPGERSFLLIRQVLLSESRESLLVEGIQALASHMERRDCADVLRQVFLKNHSPRIQMEALSILAVVAPLDPRAKDFLIAVGSSQQHDPRVSAFAGELLLTI